MSLRIKEVMYKFTPLKITYPNLMGYYICYETVSKDLM